MTIIISTLSHRRFAKFGKKRLIPTSEDVGKLSVCTTSERSRNIVPVYIVSRSRYLHLLRLRPFFREFYETLDCDMF